MRLPPPDFHLRQKNGDDETWQEAATYEIAYQLARLNQKLHEMTEQLKESAPMMGKGS